MAVWIKYATFLAYTHVFIPEDWLEWLKSLLLWSASSLDVSIVCTWFDVMIAIYGSRNKVHPIEYNSDLFIPHAHFV